MSELEKTIHDPVHGSIRVSGLVLSLLDTPEVQRLRRIKQLGLANLVFPGANHTRFEHVLGTANLMEQLAQELELEDQEIDLLIAAAVLHDVGHPPYSHTLEYLMTEYLDEGHMELTGKVLKGENSTCTKEEIRKAEELNAPRIPEVLSDYQIDPDEVARLLMGKHEKNYLGEMLHGEIDVDQMDYLSRDAHFTGVALGRIDTDRLKRTITVMDDELVIQRKGVEAVEGLLTARALMFSSVYFHHTTRIAELMLTNAVDDALHRDTAITKQNFFRMTDGKLAERLHECEGYSRDIINRIRLRQLFKTAYIVEQRELDSDEEKRLIETYDEWSSIREKQKIIAEKAGVEKGKVILDVPILNLLASEPRMKKVEVPVIKDGGLSKLSDVSPLASALRSRQTPRYLLQVVTPKQHIDEVRKASKEVLQS